MVEAQLQQDDQTREQGNPQKVQGKQSHYKFPQQPVFWLSGDQIQIQDTTSDDETCEN